MNQTVDSSVTIQKISSTPPNLEEDSALEFILVIEDPSPGEESQLNEELRAIAEHLDADIHLGEELDDLQAGFERLASALQGSTARVDEAIATLGSRVAAKKSNVRLHCCAICHSLFKDLQTLQAHASNQLHSGAQFQKVYFYMCKLCTFSPFSDSIGLLKHFKFHHKEVVHENDLGTKFEKITLIQMFNPDPVVLKKRIKTLGNGVLLPPDPFTRSKQPQQQRRELQQQYRSIPQLNRGSCDGAPRSVSRLSVSIDSPIRTSPEPSETSSTPPTKNLSNSNIANEEIAVSPSSKSLKTSIENPSENSESSTDFLPYQQVDQINWQFPTKRNSIKFMVKNGILPIRTDNEKSMLLLSHKVKPSVDDGSPKSNSRLDDTPLKEKSSSCNSINVALKSDISKNDSAHSDVSQKSNLSQKSKSIDVTPNDLIDNSVQHFHTQGDREELRDEMNSNSNFVDDDDAPLRKSGSKLKKRKGKRIEQGFPDKSKTKKLRIKDPPTFGPDNTQGFFKLSSFISDSKTSQQGLSESSNAATSSGHRPQNFTSLPPSIVNASMSKMYSDDDDIQILAQTNSFFGSESSSLVLV